MSEYPNTTEALASLAADHAASIRLYRLKLAAIAAAALAGLMKEARQCKA